MMSFKSGASIAATAALLALSAAAPTASAFAKGTEAKVPCYGVNGCKGQSDCKSGKHDCKGQNDCKGQGFKDLTKAQCAAKGGSLTAPQ
jgi:uncharacterized membrane protein